MVWIKRNLFFVVGGAVALLLLGAAGFYIYKEWAYNTDKSDKLNELYGTLKNLQSQSPAPGNEQVDNTKLAKEQESQIQKLVETAGKYFQPIPQIPTSPVTSETFAGGLRRTVDTLQKEADNFGVMIPPKYDFSFSAQRPLVKFAPGSLEPLAVQLGEVKAIVEAVISARVNAFDSIQRLTVSDDDKTGPQSDYILEPAVTNNLAVMTPYVVTFRCFTPELSRVLAVFATSSNAFLIKSVNVHPAGAAISTGATTSPELVSGMVPGALPAAIQQLGAVPATAQPVGGKGGRPTVLKEQLLKVSMQVVVVKLLPKK